MLLMYGSTATMWQAANRMSALATGRKPSWHVYWCDEDTDASCCLPRVQLRTGSQGAAHVVQLCIQGICKCQKITSLDGIAPKKPPPSQLLQEAQPWLAP